MECPHCGSRFLRPSSPRDLRERVRSWLFLMPARCNDCSTRFVIDTLGLAHLRFAKCPKCERMDLNKWTGDTFQPRGKTKWKIALGAKRFRCEYCRLNFSSFRTRKEVFSFRRWKKLEEARLAASASIQPEAPPDNPSADLPND